MEAQERAQEPQERAPRAVAHRCRGCGLLRPAAARKCAPCARAREAANRAAGLCRCGQTPPPGKRTCALCLGHAVAVRTRRLSDGRCACGLPLVPGRKGCRECLAYRRGYNERRRSYDAAPRTPPVPAWRMPPRGAYSVQSRGWEATALLTAADRRQEELIRAWAARSGVAW